MCIWVRTAQDEQFWGVMSAWDLNWLCLEEHLLPPGQSGGSVRWARSPRPCSNLGVLPPALLFWFSCLDKTPTERMREWTRLLWFSDTDQFYLLELLLSLPAEQNSKSELSECLTSRRNPLLVLLLSGSQSGRPSTSLWSRAGHILVGGHQLEELISLQSECQDISQGCVQPSLFKNYGDTLLKASHSSKSWK